MDKKMNYLAFIPIFGSVVLLLWIFIKTIKKEISMKQLNAYMASSAFVGFLSILVSVLLFKFIGSQFATSTFINEYLFVLGFILGGYLLNLFVFAMINRHFR